MRELVVPAGATIRLTATARGDRDLHRWGLALLPIEGGAARLTFGSRIGRRDVHQRIDIAAQDVDCRLEIRSQHESADGWADDQATPQEDTPTRLAIGFCDPSCPGARSDDVLLSFAFGAAGGGTRKEREHGQGPEEIEQGSSQAQAIETSAAAGRPLVP